MWQTGHKIMYACAHVCVWKFHLNNFYGSDAYEMLNLLNAEKRVSFIRGTDLYQNVFQNTIPVSFTNNSYLQVGHLPTPPWEDLA